MRRPARTRRLSIAAIWSLLAFMGMAGAGVRSFWIADELTDVRSLIGFAGGLVYFSRLSPPNGFGVRGYTSMNIDPHGRAIFSGFSTRTVRYAPKFEMDSVIVPIWPLLLLLLIAPVWWLIARSANAPAFPVITERKSE